MAHQQHVLREGLVVGVLGATGVAVWFLLVDWMAGSPLYTPLTLGAALYGIDAGSVVDGGELLLVLAYTIFHYGAFMLVGIIAALLTHLSEQTPEVLALLLIFFVIFEMGFYGLVAAFSATRLLNGLEWYQIAVGNLLASVLMGGYLWRAHPSLRTGLSDALSH